MNYKVILDSNFFLASAELRVDIYAELDRQMPGAYELLLPDVAVGELEAKIMRIKRERPRAMPTLRRQLKLAQELAQARGVQTIHVERSPGEPIDDLLLHLAGALVTEGVIPVIATNDADLRRKARAVGYPTAWVRAKKVVEVSLR